MSLMLSSLPVICSPAAMLSKDTYKAQELSTSYLAQGCADISASMSKE